MRRFSLFRSAAVAAIAMAAASMSQAEPAQTIRLVVGFAPGGPVDTIARAFAEQMRLATGNTLLVENRAGASGKIAFDTVMNAPADGLTVLIAPASVMELAPTVMPALTFDPIQELTAIGSLAEYGFAVAAGPASGARDVSGYKAWAAAHPSRSSFASPGQGTPQHFLGAQLHQALGVDLVHIPYKGGAPALNDVMGGQVPMLIATEQLMVPYQGQDKLRTLFITSKQRNPLMPEVPTASEVGLPELVAVDWFGAFLKTGTAQRRLDAWRADVDRVVRSPGYREAMGKLGYRVPSQQPEDFCALLQGERAVWTDRVRLSHFKPAD
ncbi:Bug family tripartite tricarboxylate transporter substrate binding protein [Bordetella genomosp. 12]|uniref:ABC transporter substrate-binding protein n=1 Tax=Bordetella genomosp. 12 TaxID=463035 RepID=A0A261VDR4_9BORD|nr:tripartite tricarboxylate transporter substrate-binding protein [Bordetella genomosp. 12]OZI71303.1 hypothetical protein CAL22_15770 [Bordetella genomosp. 12]